MIHCIAIDDEPIALSIIKEYCSRYGDIRLECFTSPPEGMRQIGLTHPDIVFLDIEMTSHNGIELARRLPEGTVLIFTTAYSHYALDGFNVNAIDFLHKPIFYPRFVQAIDKAVAWMKARNATAPASSARRESLTLKSEYRSVVIPLDRISYIEAMDNYVKVYRRSDPMLMSQVTMKQVERMLPADRFIRVHRSFIVPLDMIDSFSNRTIRLRGVAAPIPVGRTYSESFQNLYEIFHSKHNKHNTQ